MDELARSTWASLVDAYDLDVDWGEVTITHTVLLALKRLLREQSLPLLVERVRAHDEKASGADFELWVQSASGNVVGFSIQAKRVYLGRKKPEYQALGHKGALPKEKQYDTLLRHAAKNGTVPFHLFYNGWALPRTDIAFPSGRDTELFGCAVVRTSEVRRIRNANVRRGMNEVSRFAKISMPWSDLLRLPSGGSAGGGGGSSDGGTSGGGNPTSGIPDPSQSPAAPAPLRVSDEDLRKLLELHSAEPVDDKVRIREGLPDYVTAALSSTAAAGHEDLQDDPTLPEVVAVIKGA
ncbi:DUF6615 family protein [Microbacterium proteolyticum]|uniref:DUF6615 family protein n=2 Tax=Microbacterium TaxID=33882 RepID=UPI002417BB32|nr:DUF6615 family protein [Microbacterium proteolyticum]